MMEWWNDLRMLVARYLVASESMERSGPIAAAVRGAGYASEDEEDEEEEASRTSETSEEDGDVEEETGRKKEGPKETEKAKKPDIVIPKIGPNSRLVSAC